MKRIGVISDIHADPVALNHALAILRDAAVDEVFVCGDTVGYGKLPNECCERIRSSGCRAVAGNHDCAVVDRADELWFSGVAQEGICFTRRVISGENLAWLRDLPLVHREEDMFFVHASLPDPERWRYLTLGPVDPYSPFQDVRESLAAMNRSICFVGHSHVPTIFSKKTGSAEIEVIDPAERTYELAERQAIVDVGSVSRPRHSGQEGSLVIYDCIHRTVEFRFFSARPSLGV